MGKKPLLFLFLSLAICWTAKPGHAFESWNGEVTKNINLRKLPGLNGEIITGLQKGDKVVIKSKHGDWYKIVLERGIYGCKGWVYGEYIRKIDEEQKIEEESFSEKGKIKTRLDGLLQERPSEIKTGKEQQHNRESNKKFLSKVNIPVAVEGKKGEPLKEGMTKISEKSFPEGPLEGEETNPAFVFQYPEKTPDEESPFLVKEAGKGEQLLMNDKKDFNNPQNIKMIIRVLSRLLPVLLSCLALMFSYKAFQLAKGPQR